jgi:hypothetical protein
MRPYALETTTRTGSLAGFNQIKHGLNYFTMSGQIRRVTHSSPPVLSLTVGTLLYIIFSVLIVPLGAVAITLGFVELVLLLWGVWMAYGTFLGVADVTAVAGFLSQSTRV